MDDIVKDIDFERIPIDRFRPALREVCARRHWIDGILGIVPGSGLGVLHARGSLSLSILEAVAMLVTGDHFLAVSKFRKT